MNTIWEVMNPVALGNCTVSISSALDTNFTALRPTGKVAYDEEFSFACGRQEGFEYQEFELPLDYACDQCTLQVQWSTPAGVLYSCSDLMIIGNKVENCMAKCLNGGACVNGVCVCTKNFNGDFCENDTTESSNAGWILLILVLIAGLGAAAYFLFQKRIQETWMKPKQDEPLEKNFIEKEPKPIQVE